MQPCLRILSWMYSTNHKNTTHTLTQSELRSYWGPGTGNFGVVHHKRSHETTLYNKRSINCLILYEQYCSLASSHMYSEGKGDCCNQELILSIQQCEKLSTSLDLRLIYFVRDSENHWCNKLGRYKHEEYLIVQCNDI